MGIPPGGPGRSSPAKGNFPAPWKIYVYFLEKPWYTILKWERSAPALPPLLFTPPQAGEGPAGLPRRPDGPCDAFGFLQAAAGGPVINIGGLRTGAPPRDRGENSGGGLRPAGQTGRSPAAPR